MEPAAAAAAQVVGIPAVLSLLKFDNGSSAQRHNWLHHS
jgi:hypothetical protein